MEKLREAVADFLVAKMGHVLQDLVPVLDELLLADGVVSILVQLPEQDSDPSIPVVNVKGKMVVKDVNKLQLASCNRTILAEVKLIEHSFCLCHGGLDVG